MSKKKEEVMEDRDVVIHEKTTVDSQICNFRSFRAPRRRVVKEFHKPSLTKQSMRDECDINFILKKHQKQGTLDSLRKTKPEVYGDFSDSGSYQEALNIVMDAQEQFAGLSANVRKFFDNDPEKFLAFMEDPRNAEKWIELGLATRRQVDAVGGGVQPDPKKEQPNPKDSDAGKR
nr:MAG: internal scaffolding protein [Microvirus sp.]